MHSLLDSKSQWQSQLLARIRLPANHQGIQKLQRPLIICEARREENIGNNKILSFSDTYRSVGHNQHRRVSADAVHLGCRHPAIRVY